MKKLLASILSAAMLCTSLVGCASGDPSISGGQSTSPGSGDAGEAHLEETLTVLVPPVIAEYSDMIPAMQEEFHEMYPWITLEFISTSWEDYEDKLNVMVNAGSPPDITYPSNSITAIQQYLSSGMLLDLSDYISDDILSDYDEGAVNFYRNGDALYGLPMWVGAYTLGGNKEYLEAAGIDWKKIQQEGWTFSEFAEDAAKGVKKAGDVTDVYGFIFACSGVAATDILDLLVCSAGMETPIDPDGKYAYTDENFLKCLQFVRGLIDAGTMPLESSSVDAGKRWNMMLTGNTMLTGKGLSNFELLAKKNNKLLEEDPAAAVDGSKHLEYVGMPMPTLEGCEYKTAGSVSGMMAFRQKENPTPEHIDNMIKALQYLTSGKVVAEMCALGASVPANQSGRDAMDWAMEKTGISLDPDNAKFNERVCASIYTPNTSMTSEQSDKVTRIKEEVILPSFQALLADEMTPEQMYEKVCKAAIEQLGEDGVR